MKPLRAYSLILLAFFLPVGCSLATYEGRGGLFPFQIGMLFADLIAYVVLFYVAILSIIALYKTFVAKEGHQSSRKELSVRLVIVIGLMISPLFTGEPTYGWNEADFAKKISVELDGTNYTVPVKYLDRSWKEDGKIVSVSLIALLPNMEPRTMSNKEEFTSHNDGQGRRISITLRKANKPDSGFEKYGDLTDKANNLQMHFDFFSFAAGLTKTPEQKFGLKYFEKGEIGYTTEMYVADDKSSGVYFQCGGDRKDYRPICETSIPYKGNVMLSYSFRKTYLKDWKEIQTQVLSLVKSLENS